MARLYETKLWRLELPDTWSVRESCGQELVTLFRPDGVGILCVLSVDEQASLTNDHGERFSGFLTGKTYETTHGDKFTRRWALSCCGQKLVVRYSCSAKNAELERLEVDEIVRSISEAS